jgi:prepilin-type N-terminal cleavage/methylation domain-containing protein
MKPAPSIRRSAGFTLIELIVTMSILSVILLMALQVTESTRRSIRVSEAKSVNDAIARRAFDLIARDLSQMIVRDDARIEFKSKNGNDTFQFYANTRGLTPSADVAERSVSLVSYLNEYDSQNGYELKRRTLGHDFDAAAGDNLTLDYDGTKPNDSNTEFDPISNTAQNLQSLSSNIFRFELQYLYENPKATTDKILREVKEPNSTSNDDEFPAQKYLRGITVTLATLDDRSRRAIQVGRLETLAGLFPDASADKDTLTEWTAERDRLALNGSASLPKDALQSIRCYQRTFLIP